MSKLLLIYLTLIFLSIALTFLFVSIQSKTSKHIAMQVSKLMSDLGVTKYRYIGGSPKLRILTVWQENISNESLRKIMALSLQYEIKLIHKSLI